jgi:hypothetical protein
MKFMLLCRYDITCTGSYTQASFLSLVYRGHSGSNILIFRRGYKCAFCAIARVNQPAKGMEMAWHTANVDREMLNIKCAFGDCLA